MGNTDPSKINGAQDVLADYKQIRRENNGIVLSDKQEENTYFLKEFSFANKVQFKKELSKYEQLEKNSNNENLLNLVRVSSREFNNFCSDSYKIYAVYEYASVNLEDEINARRKQQKYFEQQELWSILQSCANALSELKPVISMHPRNIFVVPDGVLKVTCNDMIQEDYRCFMKEQYYYAPQKIQDFHKIDNENSMRKQTIFSLGMTILHAALLQPLYDCYNYQKFQFIQGRLEQRIEELVNLKYSEDFIQILAMIVEPNPNKRASLMQVHGMLTKIWNTETEQNTQNNDHQQHDADNQTNEINKSNKKQQVENVKPNNQKPEIITNRIENQQVTLQPSSSQQSFQGQFHTYSRSHLPTYDNISMSHHNHSYSQYYQPPSVNINKQNLFTDPKLLEMIRKDLHDLGELKRSSMMNTFAPYDNYISSSFYSKNNSYYAPSVYVPPTDSLPPVNSSLNQNTNKSYKQSPELKPRDSNKEYPQKSMENQKQEQASRGFGKASKTNAVYVVQQYEDGRRFQGNVVDGVKQGYGKFIYEDGAYYEGEFKDGKMQGKGTLYYEPGRPAYQGEWIEDQFSGYGVLHNQNPVPLDGTFNYNDFNNIQNFWVRYEGNFKRDDKCGEGVLVLSNGQEFRGQFECDFINGNGVFLTCDNQQIRGVWRQNVLVQLDD